MRWRCAGGPLIGVSFALIVCQIIPYCIYIHRHRERLLGAQGEPKTEEPAEVG